MAQQFDRGGYLPLISPLALLLRIWDWFLLLDAGLFLAGCGMLLLVWIGYPALLWVQAWRRRMPPPPELEQWPRFSLIIAAHNEAAVIGARLENALQLDYPADRLEILVVDDGSEDATAECVRASGGTRVRLLSMARRHGKAAALNLAVRQAAGEILVFSDASNFYAADALRRLAEPFADPRVGAVAGDKQVASRAGVGGGESVYWRYENLLLRLESETGSAVAGSGEILAVRRELYRPLPEQVMVNDDLFQILQVVSRGQRVAFVTAARSYEHPSARARDEWERRSRMAAGRWQALRLLDAQLRRMHGWNRLKVWCHCRLRQLSALWMGIALAASLPLAFAAAVPLWLRALAWIQLGFYIVAGLAAAARSLQRDWGHGEALYFFCLAQFACLNGWRRYCNGRQAATWARTQRSLADAPGTAFSRHAVAGSVFWAYSSYLLGKLLVFATTMLLARLLLPGDFGEVAIVLSGMSLLETLGSLGLASAVIYERQDAESAANLGFWLLLPASLAMIALAWMAAPAMARFFHAPTVAPMLRLLSFSLLCTAFSSSPDALLRRQLEFRKKLFPDLAQALAKGLSSVLLALTGFGAWSLIWGQLLGGLVYAATLWRMLGWRPRWSWSNELARRMLRYARHIYLMEVSGTLLFDLDAFTIGRMLGPAALGYYALAYRIPDLALLNLIYIFSRVIFPAFSRLQTDLDALRRALLETLRYSSLLTLPLATGILLTARPFILTAYGWNWMPAIPVLRVLALYALVRAISHHFGDVYKAMGRPVILSRFTLAWALVLPPCLIEGARWAGIYGVACGLLLARVVMTLLHFTVLVIILRVPLRRLMAAFQPAAEGSLFMAALLLPGSRLLEIWPPKLELPLLVLLGVAGYLFWLRLRHASLLRKIWQIAIASVRAKAGASVATAVEASAGPAAAPLSSIGSES